MDENYTNQAPEESENVIQGEPISSIEPSSEETAPIGQGFDNSDEAGTAKESSDFSSSVATNSTVDPAKKICMKCGAELAEDQVFCPKCGQRIGEPINEDSLSPKVNSKSKSKIGIIVGILVAAAALAIIVFVFARGKKGPDLIAIYNEHCSSSYASVASDGSYLSIDTNPFDLDDYSNSEAIEAILAVNDALGLPESVITKMSSTRALDGMQTATGDGIEVSWTYHPDNGLEVLYSLSD